MDVFQRKLICDSSLRISYADITTKIHIKWEVLWLNMPSTRKFNFGFCWFDPGFLSWLLRLFQRWHGKVAIGRFDGTLQFSPLFNRISYLLSILDEVIKQQYLFFFFKCFPFFPPNTISLAKFTCQPVIATTVEWSSQIFKMEKSDLVQYVDQLWSFIDFPVGVKLCGSCVRRFRDGMLT